MSEDSNACCELDVAVIGGGPAGALCALALAQQGISVVLIFDTRIEKDTIELVSGRANRLIERLVNKPLIDLIECIEIHETISLWGTRNPVSWNAMYNPWGVGVAVSRKTLDKAFRELALNAGVKIFSDTKVQRVRQRNNLWEITFLHKGIVSLLHSRFLALATGRGTDLVGRIRRERPSNLVLTAIMQTTDSWQADTLYLEATKNGWWYSIPCTTSDHLVGYYVGIGLIKQSKLPLHDIFFQQLRSTKLVGSLTHDTSAHKRIVGQLAGVQSYDRILGDSWISVGDAAFASDPLSGMGIEFAVESASLSASVIRSGLDPSTMTKYGLWVNDFRKQHLELLNSYLSVVNTI
jgi:flavin-dependent dehydrogenase